MLAAAVYAAVLADAIVLADVAARPLVALVGAVGAVLLLSALWRRSEELLPWALASLGAAYAVALVVHGGSVDERVPVVGAGLLLCGELAAWSIQERAVIHTEPAVAWSRALAVGGLVLGGLVAATAVVAVGAAPPGRGLLWTVAGAAAALGVVGLAVALMRRQP